METINYLTLICQCDRQSLWCFRNKAREFLSQEKNKIKVIETYVNNGKYTNNWLHIYAMHVYIGQ